MSVFEQWVAENMKDPEFAQAYAEMDREIAAQRGEPVSHEMNDGFIEGSDNVFADLGLPNADELLIKSDLVIEITREISRRSLTLQQVYALTGASQQDVTRILSGRLGAFSRERLAEILRRLREAA